MTKETLILLSANETIYAENYTGKTGVKENPFKLGSVNKVHPVILRLEDEDSEDQFNFSFKYIYTRSEKYGDEEGFIRDYYFNYYSEDLDFIDLVTYEELNARKELTSETIELLDSKTYHFEETFRKAREEYIKSLERLGYVEERISGYEEDTEDYMVHPLYLDQWKKEGRYPKKKYPSWAVKEIGYFAEQLKTY